MPPKRLAKHKVALKKSTEEIQDCPEPELVVVNVSNKGIVAWSDELLPKELAPSLIKGINASKNCFTSIELPNVKNYTGLQFLDFSRNLLADLNNMQWSMLSSIRELDISRNILPELPVGITDLPLLEVLNISHNLLRRLPDNMNHLRSLRSLDASHNEIDSVGDQLEDLPYLEELNLTHNKDITDMAPRTTRLFQKRALLSSKAERRILIRRALCIRKNVFNREQESIMESIESSVATGDINPYP
mmetsp:Transcript_36037/g.36720  ORF Transcript_36037/g.36720 Transcript_36037/m.36720 type:complete len:246 (+) Transcript_36037:108-845(+)